MSTWRNAYGTNEMRRTGCNLSYIVLFRFLVLFWLELFVKFQLFPASLVPLSM